MNKNVIALRKGFVVVPKTSGKPQPRVAQLVASVQAELMNLGYMLSEDAFNALSKSTQAFITTFYSEVVAYLTNELGNKHAYRPFYVNFPQQVMELSDVELFLNAVCHYWSNGTWEPAQGVVDRGIKLENTKFTVIKLGTEAAFKKIFTGLVSINQSLTEDDKEVVQWFINNQRESLVMPTEIPFKETLCLLASKGLDVPVKTPTDVLRIAVAMSGGDISLPQVPKKLTPAKLRGRTTSWYVAAQNTANEAHRETFKFAKFTRPGRRYLVSLFEKSNLDLGEMQARVGRFLRLAERLHIGEFATTAPKTVAAFKALREQDKKNKIRTFEARVNLAFDKSYSSGMKVLLERPGMLARRLDWLLRTFQDNTKETLAAFSKVSAKVSLKVLFELYSHFEARRTAAPRTIMLKSKRAKMKTLDPLPPMSAALVKSVHATILEVMRAQFKTQVPLGNVYIDEQLKSVPLPFSMRSLNSSIKTYIRGTRVPFGSDNSKVVRAFVHWFDEHGTNDLDLSAGLYDSNFKAVGHVSWTALRFGTSRDYAVTHSGDVRHRKGPCAEYIDVKIDDCLANGVRYVVVQVYNYNGTPMHTVKDCVFGVMGREFPEQNKIFVPKTIEGCMQMANEGTSVTICILDLLERNYIWADIEGDRSFAVIEFAGKSNVEILQALTQPPKFSVYDLLKLHGEARGRIVKSADDADTVFDWSELVTDYAKIASYMS